MTRHSNDSAATKLGFAWYTAEQWDALKNYADDPSALDDTYLDWLAQATRAFAKLQAEGVDVVRVAMDVADLRHWCEEKRLPLDSRSRARFIAEKLRETHP